MKIWSPLAAVHMEVPLPIPVVVSTVKSDVSVNRPSCVASPGPNEMTLGACCFGRFEQNPGRVTPNRSCGLRCCGPTDGARW